jgi:MFS family permease
VLRAQAIVVALTEFGMSFAATTYMICRARCRLSDQHARLIFALGGLGSLFGSWLAARLAKRFEPRSLLVGGLVVWALGSACAPLAAAATALGIALLALQQIVGDAGAMVYQITDRTLRQTRAPEEFLARVDAGIRTLGYGATLAGALISGALAEIFGARRCLASSALIGVAARAAARPDTAPVAAAALARAISTACGITATIFHCGRVSAGRVRRRTIACRLAAPNKARGMQGTQPSAQPVHSRRTS